MSESSEALHIKRAEFLFGAPTLADIRKRTGPEIAIIGRSNVGKSTFVNRLCGRKVARVSGRPGCTQELNFYHVDGVVEGGAFDLTVVDMPGFGFARLSKEEREEISRLTVDYLRNREQLRVVILLNDCRRQPAEDEVAVQRLCIEAGVHCVIVATKLDKEKRSQHARLLKEVAAGFGLEHPDIMGSGEGMSPVNIWSRVISLL
ncbi:MAG: YihA family ribosome biosis GTP-binding protein [Pseudomonadota bacterium]